MALKFGIFDHMEQQPAIPLDQQYRERLDLLALADHLGFYGYHLAEHHSAPLSVAPSQSVFLAAASQRTERIQLIPLVYCLPLYHPLRLVEEIAMLDNLSGGRLQIGVGRGISSLEHRFWGNDPNLAALFREAFEIVLAGLTHPRLTYHGEHYVFEDVPIVLAPKQKPYPAHLVPWQPEVCRTRGLNHLGGGSLKSLPAFAARYREVSVAHRYDADRLNPHVPEPKVGAVKVIFVADTDAEANVVARQAFMVRAQNWPKPGYEDAGTETGNRPTTQHPSLGGDYEPRQARGGRDRRVAPDRR